MDKRKVAKELVAIAKRLTARDLSRDDLMNKLV